MSKANHEFSYLRSSVTWSPCSSGGEKTLSCSDCTYIDDKKTKNDDN